MAVERGRDAVSGPTGVSHRGLGKEHAVHVDLVTVGVAVKVAAVGVKGERGGDGLGNVFPESSDLADLLEEDDGGLGGVSVDTDA
jgi:hypothetical protein